MPTTDPSGEDFQPLNPYTPSEINKPRAEASRGGEDVAPRHYQARMDWLDRRRFLRTVAFLRITAVAGAVVLGSSLLGLYQLPFETVQKAFYQDLLGNILYAVPICFSLTRWILSLYGCWLYWSFADALAATAGGTTTSMNKWSQLQLRIAHYMVAILAIGLASLGWDWIDSRYLVELRRPFGL